MTTISPLAPEVDDESILALASLTDAARRGFSGLDRSLRARVVIELRDALGRPRQNPIVSEVLQDVLESEEATRVGPSIDHGFW